MDERNRSHLHYLHDAFSNIDKHIVNEVYQQNQYDLNRTIDVLTKFTPNPAPYQPAQPPHIPQYDPRFSCFPQTPQRPRQYPQPSGNQPALPNEYVHRFEMKKGDSFVTAAKPLPTVREYRAPLVDKVYFGAECRDNDVKNNDLINLGDCLTLSPKKDTIPYEELYKQLEENKKLMRQMMDFMQNQMQSKQAENPEEKTEVEKKEEELKKLKKLQEDIGKKLEENREDVIKHVDDMFDSFKEEMQSIFADKMKKLSVEDEEKEKAEEAVAGAIDSLFDTAEATPPVTSFEDILVSENINLITEQIQEEIITPIKKGLKVMVLLRGLPGSGKSTLASSILRHSYDKVNADEFIFAFNDYFQAKSLPMDDVYHIEMAHKKNQTRCYEAMKYGVSPVIIDNDNLELNDMRIYAALATLFGYMIRIAEPDTPWKFDPQVLAEKNSRCLSEQEIRKLMQRHQRDITYRTLKREFNLTYKVDGPGMRMYPSLRQ